MEFIGAATGFLTALTITFFIGFFLVSLLLKNTPLWLRVLFGIPLGFGLTSVTYFLSMAFGVYNFGVYKSFEFVAVIVLGAAYYFLNEQKQPQWLKAPKLSPLLSIASAYGLMIFLKYHINNPVGSWDGFRIFNIKAEFLYQYDGLWQKLFTLPHFMMHNDYPLSVPSSFARLWKYTGTDLMAANVVFGALFTFSTVFLLYFVIKKYKNPVLAAVISSVLALSTVFLTNGAAMSADVPMAYLVFCTGVCILFYFDKKEINYLILGGIFAGLSAWTKNEGMMFMLVYAFVMCAYLLYCKELKKILAIILPLIPFVILSAYFKVLAKTPNDLFYGIFLLKTYKHVFKFSYYIVIFKWLLKMLWMKFYTLFVLLLLPVSGFCIKDEIKCPFILISAIIMLMGLGYFVIYLLSPHDLTWLLQNSLDRIYLQMTPLFLLILALSLRFFEKDMLKC